MGLNVNWFLADPAVPSERKGKFLQVELSSRGRKGCEHVNTSPTRKEVIKTVILSKGQYDPKF
eukprot:2214143-Amphidinium_carterae.1